MRLQEKIPNLWRCVFFDSAQTYTASGQNALHYDGSASGSIIYAYVNNNPVNFTDPSGLAAQTAINAVSTYWGKFSDAAGNYAERVVTGQVAREGLQNLANTLDKIENGDLGNSAALLDFVGGGIGSISGKVAAKVASELPAALKGGEASVQVYNGVRSGEPVYVGITNNIARRQV